MLKLINNFMFLVALATSTTAASSAGTAPTPLEEDFYPKLLACHDDSFFTLAICNDGVYLVKESLSKSPYSHLINQEKFEKKIFDITQPPPYRWEHIDERLKVEYLEPFSEEWKQCLSVKTQEGLSFSLENFYPEKILLYRLNGRYSKTLTINDPYNIHKEFRVIPSDNNSFDVQHSLTPENEESFKLVFTETGKAPRIISDSRYSAHVIWRSENRGNQIRCFNLGQTYDNDPKDWDCQYSPYHADTLLVSFRDLPGRPLKYRLYQGTQPENDYDSNQEGFNQFADVALFYVQNTLDAELPEGQFKLAGLDIPVSRYTFGDSTQKPTLAYIKGGPKTTKFGTFDPTYHALAQHFNVYVIEYRGSSEMMGEAGSHEYLNGDIGGGVVRDVVSVLRTMQRNAHTQFSDIDSSNIILAGHSFGGFILGKIMQDYQDDIQRIKGFLFLSPTLDALNTWKFFSSICSWNNWFDYLWGNSDPIFQCTKEVLDKLEENNMVSPAQNMGKMPINKKALIIGAEHDGNVSVEESMKFFIEWSKQIVAHEQLTIRSELDQFLDTYENQGEWKFSRSQHTTADMLTIFKDWKSQLSPELKARLPIDIELMEGATHHYKDSHEIFQRYINRIVAFARNLNN